MIRILGAVFAALLLAAFATGVASAQAKKKDPRCVPNFFEACQKKCIGAGGRVHLCPDYCQKKKVEYGCG
jgi:hypothetical protein